MFRRIFLIVLTINFLQPSTLFAKTLTSIEETEALSLKIVIMFQNSEFMEAFDELTKYWPLPKNEIDLMEEKTIIMMNTIHDRFGEVIGYVRTRKEAITDIATRETYLLRYENTAIRLIFTYYLNEDGWILNAFKWDDSFVDEFKDVE